MDKNKTNLVVYNEAALGYIDPKRFNLIHFLSRDIFAKSYVPMGDGGHLIYKSDKIRLANVNDFDRFRVSCEGYFEDTENYEMIREKA